MVSYTRALLIGLMGPAMQTVGVAWDLIAHVVQAGEEQHALTLDHVLFAREHLVIFAGFVLTLVCVPLGLEVAAARREALRMVGLRPQPAPEPARLDGALRSLEVKI